MSETTTPVKTTYDPYHFDAGMLVKLFVVGAFAGALGWFLYLGLTQYFIEPVFCRSPETFSICKNGGTIAWVAAHVIVMAVAVAVLAKMAVYRPLLVVLAVLIALWGAHAWLGAMPWYVGALWQALLFGLATALFGWIARASSFLFALIVSLVLIVLARAVLMFA